MGEENPNQCVGRGERIETRKHCQKEKGEGDKVREALGFSRGGDNDLIMKRGQRQRETVEGGSMAQRREAREACAD